MAAASDGDLAGEHGLLLTLTLLLFALPRTLDDVLGVMAGDAAELKKRFSDCWRVGEADVAMEGAWADALGGPPRRDVTPKV